MAKRPIPLSAFFLALALFFASGAARAEERPPIAAPTISIGVTALPVLRSASQQVDDFSSGLLQGILAAERIPGLAMIVVEGDHVMVQKSLGVADPRTLAPVNGDSVFAVGGLSEAMIGLAAMQLIEQALLLPDDDVSMLLEDSGWRGVTVAQLLTHRVAGAAEALALVVERQSGQSIGTYVEARIFLPLGMSNSHFEGGVFTTSASDMGRLLMSLLNGGAAQSGRILQPETVALMTRTHVTAHKALPGWGFVFPEMRRGGWRALTHDGASEDVAARLVFEPEAGLGYFIVLNHNPAPDTWRVLDNSLFDRVLPPRGTGGVDPGGTPAPGGDLARDVAGLYVIERGPESEVLFLKTPRGRLRVEGRDDGALVLSGAENAVLLPRPGGYWRSDEAQLNAALSDGKLLIDQLAYDRFQVWERPAPYGWLAFFLGAASMVVFVRPRRVQAYARLSEHQTAYAGPILVSLAFFFLVAAVILHRLAFTP